jgi:hypothetical protein
MAIISHTHKFCFIHTPKTAGSSISFVLNKYAKQVHIPNSSRSAKGWQIPLHEYGMHNTVSNFIDKVPDGYFKFAFVRNPFDLLASGFVDRHYVNFENFIKTSLGKDKRLFHKWTQWEYLSVNDTIAVDFVGRYEHLATDWHYICERIGIKDFNLPVKNASDKHHYTEYYNDETREIVANRYAKDLEYWGYEF